MAIAAYFLEAMDAPPAIEDSETAAWIRTEFKMSVGSLDVIKRVLVDVRACARDGVVYDPSRASSNRLMLTAIKPNTVAALIIAEAMEDGSGIRGAHEGVMNWLRLRRNCGERDVPHWGLSATYGCYQRMNPTVTVVQKRSQGSDDPHSAWCQACMAWVTQLMVRIEMDIPEEWGGRLTDDELALPWFQIRNLTLFSPHQVVDWDETHQELVMLGGVGRSARGKEMQVRFHRMPDGTIDPTGGEQEGSTLSQRRNHLSVKYSTDVRFLLGTASVILLDGTKEGRRARLLEYTCILVVTHRDYQKHQRIEIARVKRMDGDALPWVTGRRSMEDGLYNKDPTSSLCGVGPAIEKVLRDAGGLVVVLDVARLTDKKILVLAKENILTRDRLEKWRAEAKTANRGAYKDKSKDHKLSENPYKSLHGNAWELVLNSTTYMKKYLSIRKLVRHMAVESDRLMVGTRHEGKALFKHDALCLMTARATRDWMMTEMVNGRSLYSRWLLPEAGLNDIIAVNDTTTTRYSNRPPGNLPQLMALDEFGNKKLMDCVNRHVSATKRLVRGPDVATDPKYEFCDTARASSAVRRCWDPAHGPNGGAPSSRSIIAGHKRVCGMRLGEIRNVTGCMVGARAGHRRPEITNQRGARRVAGLAPWEGESEWMNSDAQTAQKIKFERCTASATGGMA